MDGGDYPVSMDFDGEFGMEVNANKVKDVEEIEPAIANGGGEEHYSNGMDIDLEAEFDAQLNELNRSSNVGLSEAIWSAPPEEEGDAEGEGESPIQNDPDIELHEEDEGEPEAQEAVPLVDDTPVMEEPPEDINTGEGFLDNDVDIATEGSLDLEVEQGGDIATEGSLDLDIEVPGHQQLTDRYIPLGAEMDLGGSEGEELPVENPETEPLQQEQESLPQEPEPSLQEPQPLLQEPEPLRQQEPAVQDEPDGRLGAVGEEEQQQLLSDEGALDTEVEAGAMTEGSLDLDVHVGAHVEDEDEDADVFESNERLESPSATYVNTTLASNASSLGAHEPAPAHAQSLITPFRDDINGDVTNVDRPGDGVRVATAVDDITVIEPTTETKLLDHKGNGDAVVPMPLIRKGFPPPFPIGYNDENLHKGNWGHKMEFMCAIFCVIFNIDSFAQFPYLMYANGGVVFLIPYMIALFLLILPLVLIEISLGQFASCSFLTCWKFCPLLKGLSIGMLLQLLGFAFLWGPFSGHSLYYIYTIFLPADELVYTTCSNAWNEISCQPLVPGNYSAQDPDYESSIQENVTVFKASFPEEEFYRNHVLMEAGSTNSLGYPLTHLMIALAVAWVVTFHIILFGIKSFGKIAYILFSAHIILLFVLLIRGAILDGAMDGIKLLFWPEVGKLLEVEVWSKALNCAMITFAPMCGILMSLSSYNKFHNNCFMDSVVLILVALFINLLSAVTYFCYVGYGNKALDVNSLHLSDKTTGETIFVMFTAIFGSLPHTRIMSFLLFFFTFLSSLSFQVVVALSLVIGFLDVFGCRHSWKVIIPVSFLVTVVSFGGGLLFITPEGPHFWEVLYKFFMPHIPFILCIIMPLALTWIYGTIPAWKFLKFQRDIKAMVGCFPIVFQGMFAGLEAVIIPVVISVAWVYNLYLVFSNIDLNFEVYQGWHIAVAIILAFVPLIIGFLSGAVMELCKYVTVYKYFTELFWLASMPLREWGPAVEENRTEHDYPIVKSQRDDLVVEEKYREYSQENVNNANDNCLRQSQAYSMSLNNEGSNPPSPRDKPDNVYPSSSDTLDRDLDPAVNSNATLPAGTPLLGLSLCSHETTL
ncbi:sodium- and chloride-dependent glycine transporter 1-like [Lytechinus variegatus]|uniref:sodium- and chloride-dependent glycine transporter 1-like n=1 Tax=Lytechinus variegatus TaxID=7654 RepID=UPI001BB2C02F|nr:sodium- and chloride-dependent glycine transporter 1-like [Lytechinus variegatus]